MRITTKGRYALKAILFLAKYHDGDHEGIMQGDIEYQQKRGFLL